MKTAVFLVVLSCAVALDVTLNQHWNLWKKTNNKNYSDVEEHIRRNIWESNLKKVQAHNYEADLGIHTFWLGMNQFADLTEIEFSKMMNGDNAKVLNQKTNAQYEFTRNPNVKLPDTVDWRDKGYVNPVTDQGQCTSDWALAATGSLEGQHFNATGKLVVLSIQNLIDCSGKQGNMGCIGGEPIQAYEYIKENNGIDTEDAYPYEGDSNRCRFKAEGVGATVTGSTAIKSKDEEALQEAVANIGPIAVAIDSSHTSFQLYKQGVYHEIFCSQIHLDRGLLAVGYGTDSGKDYWLLRNSMGVKWGEQGYIRMTRNKRNECGIATSASYPLVPKM
ncbi:unnamed protein product [Adineta steineri]|uniref:Uncharacterized protein n=1 Tax=Adineta steineri TaxID=433720 RepID=A0A819VCW8_9BILA|nr:unnamed protein product [Adineta steineri]CAF4107168.1 unnamed protein product [Adineta steineri]